MEPAGSGPLRRLQPIGCTRARPLPLLTPNPKLEEGGRLSPGERTDMTRFVITLAGMEARKEMSAHGDYIFDRIDRVMTEDMVASGELDLAILGLCESVVRIENKERGDDYWDKSMKRLLMLNPDARERCLEVMEASED